MEDDAARGRDVEGIEGAGHGDGDGVGAGEDMWRQARTLGAEQDGGAGWACQAPSAACGRRG